MMLPQMDQVDVSQSKTALEPEPSPELKRNPAKRIFTKTRSRLSVAPRRRKAAMEQVACELERQTERELQLAL